MRLLINMKNNTPVTCRAEALPGYNIYKYFRVLQIHRDSIDYIILRIDPLIFL
jgi:hypothetical protein